MDDNLPFDDSIPKEVDFENSPESTPPGAENFSMREQQHKFNGGGSGKSEGVSKRLKVFEVSRFDIHKPTVEGRYHLPPVGKPAVIATTHLTDIDVQEVAVEVGKDRRIGIASYKTNQSAPLFKPFVTAIGTDNFFPVENVYMNGHANFQLMEGDVQKMTDAVTKDGRTMVVAAHNPVTLSNIEQGWKLPDKPGLSAIILAHETGAPLIPVALDIHSEKPVGMAADIPSRVKNFVTRNRPQALMIFAEPMQLSEIPHEQLQAAVNLYSIDKRKQMSAEQIEEAKSTLSVLQKEGGDMMRVLAKMLPPEKRGIWGEPENQGPTNQPPLAA